MLLEDSILPLTGGGFNAEGSPLEPMVRRRYRMSNQSGGVMSDNKYFVNGLLIVAFLFVLSNFLGKGRYQLSSNPNNSWKLDTVTGRVWGCVRQECYRQYNIPPDAAD